MTTIHRTAGGPSDRLTAKLQKELHDRRRRHRAGVPPAFAAAIAEALERYAAFRRQPSTWAETVRKRRALFLADYPDGNVPGWLRQRGNPHEWRWMLRANVFQALVAIDVSPKSVRAKRVMAFVLGEADRLDGRPRQIRYEFNKAQWRDWLQEYWE